MHENSVSQLSTSLHSREVSSEELTRHFLERIDTLDGQLNSFITVAQERAITQARVADKQLAGGKAGPLTGIPLAHKDIFCTQGLRTSCGSRMLENFVAPYDATLVRRLADSP